MRLFMSERAYNSRHISMKEMKPSDVDAVLADIRLFHKIMHDNLSIAELDGCGNVLRHKVIRFNLENVSSGHAEQILSKALEKVFFWCDEAKKPFAMEDMALKHVSNHYGSKKRNFVTRRFAFSKVTALAESKALKHCVEICKVNPAYTSQAGKLLFVKKYGCSIHEGASIAIGRRAMGIRERLPSAIRRMLKPKQQTLPRQKQWKAAYPMTKKITASEMYQYRFA
jgi:IS605 OrfB family transposase